MTKEDIIKPENLVAKKPTLMNDNPMHYCPGCSHGVVHKLVAEVIEEMGLEDKAIGISPVGCAVFIYNYIDIDWQEAAMDVRPHLPLPSSAFGQTAWCSLTKETATWLVSVLPKPSTP
jgi:2-oxoglutarate ferredoxin oxidoreductase subunit beta